MSLKINLVSQQIPSIELIVADYLPKDSEIIETFRHVLSSTFCVKKELLVFKGLREDTRLSNVLNTQVNVQLLNCITIDKQGEIQSIDYVDPDFSDTSDYFISMSLAPETCEEKRQLEPNILLINSLVKPIVKTLSSKIMKYPTVFFKLPRENGDIDLDLSIITHIYILYLKYANSLFFQNDNEISIASKLNLFEIDDNNKKSKIYTTIISDAYKKSINDVPALGNLNNGRPFEFILYFNREVLPKISDIKPMRYVRKSANNSGDALKFEVCINNNNNNDNVGDESELLSVNTEEDQQEKLTVAEKSKLIAAETSNLSADVNSKSDVKKKLNPATTVMSAVQFFSNKKKNDSLFDVFKNLTPEFTNSFTESYSDKEPPGSGSKKQVDHISNDLGEQAEITVEIHKVEERIEKEIIKNKGSTMVESDDISMEETEIISIKKPTNVVEKQNIMEESKLIEDTASGEKDEKVDKKRKPTDCNDKTDKEMKDMEEEKKIINHKGNMVVEIKDTVMIEDEGTQKPQYCNNKADGEVKEMKGEKEIVNIGNTMVEKEDMVTEEDEMITVIRNNNTIEKDNMVEIPKQVEVSDLAEREKGVEEKQRITHSNKKTEKRQDKKDERKTEKELKTQDKKEKKNGQEGQEGQGEKVEELENQDEGKRVFKLNKEVEKLEHSLERSAEEIIDPCSSNSARFEDKVEHGEKKNVSSNKINLRLQKDCKVLDGGVTIVNHERYDADEFHDASEEFLLIEENADSDTSLKHNTEVKDSSKNDVINLNYPDHEEKEEENDFDLLEEDVYLPPRSRKTTKPYSTEMEDDAQLRKSEKPIRSRKRMTSHKRKDSSESALRFPTKASSSGAPIKNKGQKPSTLVNARSSKAKREENNKSSTNFESSGKKGKSKDLILTIINSKIPNIRKRSSTTFQTISEPKRPKRDGPKVEIKRKKRSVKENKTPESPDFKIIESEPLAILKHDKRLFEDTNFAFNKIYKSSSNSNSKLASRGESKRRITNSSNSKTSSRKHEEDEGSSSDIEFLEEEPIDSKKRVLRNKKRKNYNENRLIAEEYKTEIPCQPQAHSRNPQHKQMSKTHLSQKKSQVNNTSLPIDDDGDASLDSKPLLNTALLNAIDLSDEETEEYSKPPSLLQATRLRKKVVRYGR